MENEECPLYDISINKPSNNQENYVYDQNTGIFYNNKNGDTIIGKLKILFRRSG